jgi:hypothetical protein
MHTCARACAFLLLSPTAPCLAIGGVHTCARACPISKVESQRGFSITKLVHDVLCLSLQGSLLAYFKNGWGIVDFVSAAFSMICVFIWWDFVLRKALPFSVEVRYNVYEDLKPPANLLKLKDNGSELQDVEKAFARLQVK